LRIASAAEISSASMASDAAEVSSMAFSDAGESSNASAPRVSLMDCFFLCLVFSAACCVACYSCIGGPWYDGC